MLGLSDELENLVRKDCEKYWKIVKERWFCKHSKCKIPGLLKIEKETYSGSFISVSPKCYVLGDAGDFKRFILFFLNLIILRWLKVNKGLPICLGCKI